MIGQFFRAQWMSSAHVAEVPGKKGLTMTETVIVPPAENAGPSRDDSQVINVADEWGRQSFPASDPPQNW
jgi:hypothetical protein